MTEGIKKFIKELRSLTVKWYLTENKQIRTRPYFGACPICAVAGADSIFWKHRYEEIGLTLDEALIIVTCSDAFERLNYLFDQEIRNKLLEACNLIESK